MFNKDTNKSAKIILASDLALGNGSKGNELGTKLNYPEGYQWVMHSGAATETQTFYVHLADGGCLFFQIAHSNIGWSPTIQTSVRYFKQGGLNVYKSVTVPTSSFKVSKDKTSVTLEGASVTCKPDGSGMTIMFRRPDFEKELSFELDLKFLTEGYTIGEGKNYYNSAKTKSDEYVFHRTVPECAVSGSLTVQGQSIDLTPSEGASKALFCHALLGMKPYLAAVRWNFSYFQSPTVTLSLLQLEAPATHNSEIVAQGCLVLDGKVQMVSVDCKADAHETKLDPETKYSPPTDIEYKWSGSSCTPDAEPCSVSIRTQPAALIDKVDILAELPYVLKKTIQVFVTKPYCYMWLDRVSTTLKIGEKDLPLDGNMFHECSFLN